MFNPLATIGPSPLPPYVQPGAPNGGFFQPGRERLACPNDGSTTTVVGSSDFTYRCPTCGRQYRADGSLQYAGTLLQTVPFVSVSSDAGDANRP
jgi:ribosomal protein S27E